MYFAPRKARLTALDAVLMTLLAAGAAWLVWRMHSGLDYHWNWELLGRYVLRSEPNQGLVWGLLAHGLAVTVRLSLWATLLAAVVGGAAGLCLTMGGPALRLAGRLYVETVRNLPPLVLVFIVYFFIGDRIFQSLGLDEAVRAMGPEARTVSQWLLAPAGSLSAFVSALFTLAVYEGAYIAEIVRGGIESVERGQGEAAYALGLTRGQAMRTVVLPQAVKRILPPLAGQFISTIKDSAIVSVISIPELTFQGLELMASTFMTFEVWLAVLGMYLLLCLTLSLGAGRLEKALAARGR